MQKDKLGQGEFSQKKAKADSHIDSEKSWWQPAFILFAQLSAWIVVPVLVAVMVGKWLDRKYDTAPWLLLATVGVSFVISMFGIVKNAVSEYAKIAGDSKNKNKLDK